MHEVPYDKNGIINWIKTNAEKKSESLDVNAKGADALKVENDTEEKNVNKRKSRNSPDSSPEESAKKKQNKEDTTENLLKKLGERG